MERNAKQNLLEKVKASLNLMELLKKNLEEANKLHDDSLESFVEILINEYNKGVFNKKDSKFLKNLIAFFHGEKIPSK